MGTGYKVDYNDERFVQNDVEKQAALKENTELYSGLAEESEEFHSQQSQQVAEWGEKQAEIQKQQTDFALEQIEQQQEAAEKDYHKEQKAAWVDYQKQVNPYGVNAEKMAEMGLEDSGYSESSKVSMHNEYQNRVATARESFNELKLNFQNNMMQAQMQNDAALAEIALQTQQQQMEIALSGFEYKNTLLLEQAAKKFDIENMYYGRDMDILAQINQEKAFEEQQRQFNASLANKQRGDNTYDNEAYYLETDNNVVANNNGVVVSPTAVKDNMGIPQGMYQAIGMNRSKEGQMNAIATLLDEEKISENQAIYLLEHFGLA